MHMIWNTKETRNDGLGLLHIRCAFRTKKHCGLLSFIIYYNVTKPCVLIRDIFLLLPIHLLPSLLAPILSCWLTFPILKSVLESITCYKFWIIFLSRKCYLWTELLPRLLVLFPRFEEEILKEQLRNADAGLLACPVIFFLSVHSKFHPLPLPYCPAFPVHVPASVLEHNLPLHEKCLLRWKQAQWWSPTRWGTSHLSYVKLDLCH